MDLGEGSNRYEMGNFGVLNCVRRIPNFRFSLMRLQSDSSLYTSSQFIQIREGTKTGTPPDVRETFS